jgi:hypothetical protein
LHPYPIIHYVKPHRACDAKLDENCAKIGVSYMCGLGTDWGVCQQCYQKAQHRANFNNMIKDHGFSSGFKSFRHLQRKVENSEKHGKKTLAPDSPTGNRRKGEPSIDQIKQRSNFFVRESSDFGLLLETRKDTDLWGQSTRNMGPKSCSEGALLRYTQSAVHSMTRTVYDEMGVDVTKTDMRQLRRRESIEELIAGLDKRPEVTPEFLRDASSSTAQAMLKILGPKKPALNRSSSAPRRMTALQGAGSAMVGSGKSKSK